MTIGTSRKRRRKRSHYAKSASSLLNQQLWCWGRDIECAEGNLLTRYGLQRIKQPVGSESASIYRIELPTTRVILRGFGVFIGDDRWGGMFVPRFDFAPKLTPEPDLLEPAWSLEDLPRLVTPRRDQTNEALQLLLTLIDWIRRYEVWIASDVGLDYREESLLPWAEKHGSIEPAETMRSAWQRLGAAVANHPDQFLVPSENCHDNE